MFSLFWQWNNYENRAYLTKLRRTNSVPVFCPVLLRLPTSYFLGKRLGSRPAAHRSILLCKFWVNAVLNVMSSLLQWMWDTLHTAFDRSSGTLCTVGSGGRGRFVAWQRPVGGTTVTTDQQQAQLRRNKTKRWPAELKATCIVYQFLLNSSQTWSRVDLL